MSSIDDTNSFSVELIWPWDCRAHSWDPEVVAAQIRSLPWERRCPPPASDQLRGFVPALQPKQQLDQRAHISLPENVMYDTSRCSIWTGGTIFWESTFQLHRSRFPTPTDMLCLEFNLMEAGLLYIFHRSESWRRTADRLLCDFTFSHRSKPGRIKEQWIVR
jgi:hypothetical protein